MPATVYIPSAPNCVSLPLDWRWDGTPNQDPLLQGQVTVSAQDSGLELCMSLPHQPQPKVPLAPAGARVADLWTYDVVECFLVGPDDYLEVELGPGGHFLVLEFSAPRVLKDRHETFSPPIEVLELASAPHPTWRSRIVIPWSMVPTPLIGINAYAIVGEKYLCFKPLPGPKPDFHQPDRFASATLEPPSATAPSEEQPSHRLAVALPYREPFDWDYHLGFLAAHAMAGVETVSDGAYHRVFQLDGQTGTVRVTRNAVARRLELEITPLEVRSIKVVIERIRHLFDLHMNPYLLVPDKNSGAVSPSDSPLNALMTEHLGIRIPGAWDGFETAVCIILGQLISVEGARMQIHKLVQRFGQALPEPLGPGLTHRFPSPEVLATVDLSVLGLTRVKSGAISLLSQAVVDGSIDLSRSCDLAITRQRLLAIKGIGPWTVEMIAMRCLNDTDAFPRHDLIVRRALDLHQLDPSGAAPYRAYLALIFWKRYASSLSSKRPSKPPKQNTSTP